MNEVVVPPAPHWYKSSVVACSPDNILIYGAKNDLVIIKEKTPESPASIEFIHGAHTKHVVSVSLNKRWKEPHSYVATSGEDNIIKVWDLGNLEKKFTNKDHVEHKDSLIGAVFAGDDRVVSATSTGRVIIWNINTNETKTLAPDFFKSKVKLTCLSSCPHAAWLTAFGLYNGAVVVADLRRNGQLLYKLRGHYQSVVSLSWCPAPINVFPSHPNNVVKNKVAEPAPGKITDKKKEKKVNPWVNLVHADDNEVKLEKESRAVVAQHDFLEECDDLKSKILGLISEGETSNGEVIEPEAHTILRNTVQDPVISSKEDSDSIDDGHTSDEKCLETSSRGDERVETPRDFGRPLPQLFDPCGDFFDDLAFDSMGEKSAATESGSTDSRRTEEGEKYKEEQAEKPKAEETTVEDDKTSTKVEEADKAPIETEQTASEAPKRAIKTEESDEVVEEDPRTEYLLASAGKDKSVYIWRAGTDGRMQTFFHVQRKTYRKDKNANSWISLCWITPDTLLTSSTTGEILSWTLPKPKESNKQYKVVYREHSTLIFNIVAPPKYFSAFNWREKSDSAVWSWGQEGKLVNYHIGSQKVCFSYLTLSSGVTCFDSSSYLDPNRLAIGLRDGAIRVWDLSLPHARTITMQNYQQKFTQKVSAISWHPTKEMFLGFGTEEGRVGFINLTSRKTTLFPHFFRNQVYKVEWGPLQGDTANLGLYVVAEGKMAIYDTEAPDTDPAQLDLPPKLHVHQFAWKPDYKLLLINGRDGSLIVLRTDLSAISTFYPSDKGLNMIVWHPDAFGDSTNRSSWFAAATTKGALVFDCSSVENTENIKDKIVATFEGHLRPPLALAWCPFEGNRVATTAADGLAHVWDVTTKSLVATFVDSCVSTNPALVWSPVNPDLIIMGDRVIRVWSVSQNPPNSDGEVLAARKRQLAKSSRSEHEKAEKMKIKVEIPKSKVTMKNSVVPAVYVSNDENIASQIENMRRLMNDEQSDEESQLNPLEIFSGKDQVARLLDANYQQKEQGGKHKSCELISLWKGTIAEYVQKCIDEDRVTPSVIALAPMVSPWLWQDVCLRYAQKLSEDTNSDPLEAATYFLACHKVEEAIRCLTVNGMFKEALALAKLRLPEGSDMIVDVTKKWAEHCITTGNFENAAYCYISIKDYENAAKVLSRRSQLEFLEFAAELAEKGDNKGLYDSIKFKCGELNTQEKKDVSRVDVVLEQGETEVSQQNSYTIVCIVEDKSDSVEVDCIQKTESEE